MNMVLGTWRKWDVLACIGTIAVLAACGSSSSGGDQGGSGGSGANAGTDGGGVGGAGGGCPGSCDDGFNCTIDTCNAGKCAHSIGPNTGATACPTGQYCTADKGCVASPACATVADCTKVWSGDACKSNLKCDAASSVCTFDVLDKDHDGYPPQVCGGGDCNDSDPNIHPGAKEICDGVDNDCNGIIDDEPAADSNCQSSKGPFVCKAGQCVCPSPFQPCDPGLCVDTSTNPWHCGNCDSNCSWTGHDAGTCQGGHCQY